MAITVLPWRNASELAFVRDCFYPLHATSSSSIKDDIYSIAFSELPGGSDLTDHSTTPRTRSRTKNYDLAIKRVAMWNFRSPRSIPHAVTATAALIEAKMYDELGTYSAQTDTVFDWTSGDARRSAALDVSQINTPSTPALSESALKSIYAMAFLRFVNGFVDRDVSRASHRTGLSKFVITESEVLDEELSNNSGRSAGESSMYAFATAIGMPIAFVDLRHRCVHGSALPELSVLRRMSERALEWLWERWWKGNADGDSGRWRWEQQTKMAEVLHTKETRGDADRMEG